MSIIEIYSGDTIKAQMIANLLQENGIPAFVRNAYLGNIAPFCVSPGGIKSTSVDVLKEYAEEARNVMNSFFETDNDNEK